MNTSLRYPILAACLAALSASAYAVPTLVVYDVNQGALQAIQDNVAAPGNNYLSTQNGGADSNPAALAVTYIGTVGDWTVNIVASVVNNVDLLSGTVTSNFTANGYGLNYDEIAVWFDADGWTAGPGTNEVTSLSGTVGGSAGSNLYAGLYTDPSSYVVDYFLHPTLLNPPGGFLPPGPGAYSVSGSGLIPVSSSYSLVPFVDIQTYGTGATSTFLDKVTVPDTASTAALFGLALLALCAVRRRLVCAAL
jgi:hypothetical protein